MNVSVETENGIHYFDCLTIAAQSIWKTISLWEEWKEEKIQHDTIVGIVYEHANNGQIVVLRRYVIIWSTNTSEQDFSELNQHYHMKQN